MALIESSVSALAMSRASDKYASAARSRNSPQGDCGDVSPPTSPGHLTHEQLEECYRHMEAHDHYETLPDQLGLLHDAGFSRVDCVWRLRRRFSLLLPH